MKKLILILLFISTLLNAQLLDMLSKDEQPELNTNTSLDFSYTNVLSGWDFTSGWENSGTTIIDNNSFSTAGYGGLYKSVSPSIIQNNVVKLDIIANTTATQFRIINTAGTVTLMSARTGSVNYSGIVVWSGSSMNFFLNNQTAGTTDITSMSLTKLIAPTGFTTTITTATNYVIEDNGCKFVEVTGETKITMNDTLEAGYYKLKVTQDWTQGKLWAYNGTTTYNFPQSDGEYTVKIYLPGNKPLVIGCDNNTISTITYLSVR